jgi:glycosyltransferase involved in cell wall biosynthesis
MKILILQDRLRLGGTEAQALALGSQWLDLGHDVRMLVFRPGGELAESPAAKKLSPKVLQRVETWLDSWAPGLDKAVIEAAPDVVVAFGREANAKLWRLRRLVPRPVLVATLRSGRDQPPRFWRALRSADAVVANARWAADEAAAQGVAKGKLHTIYSGLLRPPRAADPAAARADWRKRARTPDSAVVLLCVAGFRRGKGQDVLLQAAAQLPAEPAWQLWFAGGGPYLEPCKKIAMKLKLKERIRFTGVVSDPSTLYAAADVAVMASLAEALPNFLIEAQSAGLPVVATAVGGVGECFENPRTGLAVPDGEPAALVAALTRAIQDADWRAAAKEPAQARAQELFDAHRNAARWIELFTAATPRD